ncbi:MAG: hypothetical protein ABIG30_03950 [Candidatus Aenigmatarchaeota archaeon]
MPEVPVSKDKRELILALHNTVQSVVLLENIASKKGDERRLLFEKILNTRESVKRAGNSLLNTRDAIFEARTDKYIFLHELYKISNIATNISGILAIESIGFSEEFQVKINDIISDISVAAQSIDFTSVPDTSETIKKIRAMRESLLKKDLDKKIYVLMEKVVDGMQQIVFSLDKINQF